MVRELTESRAKLVGGRSVLAERVAALQHEYLRVVRIADLSRAASKDNMEKASRAGRLAKQVRPWVVGSPLTLTINPGIEEMEKARQAHQALGRGISPHPTRPRTTWRRLAMPATCKHLGPGACTARATLSIFLWVLPECLLQLRNCTPGAQAKKEAARQRRRHAGMSTAAVTFRAAPPCEIVYCSCTYCPRWARRQRTRRRGSGAWRQRCASGWRAPRRPMWSWTRARACWSAWTRLRTAASPPACAASRRACSRRPTDGVMHAALLLHSSAPKAPIAHPRGCAIGCIPPRCVWQDEYHRLQSHAIGIGLSGLEFFQVWISDKTLQQFLQSLSSGLYAIKYQDT